MGAYECGAKGVGERSTFVAGGFDGNGHDDLAGLTSLNEVFYTIHLNTWPLVGGDFETRKVVVRCHSHTMVTPNPAHNENWWKPSTSI